MGNHVLGEVFDYEIYDMNNNFLFEIKTTKSNTIENNRLIIEDCLVNTKFFSDMMYGKYSNKNVKVLGRTIVRDFDTHMDDGILYMSINVATINSYTVTGRAGDAYGSRMVIEFADRDRNLERNFNLELIHLKDDKNESGGFTFFE